MRRFVDTHPDEAWVRLGHLLRERRGQLDPKFSSLAAFARDTQLSLKTLSQIENASRTSFRPAMLAAIERAYRWQPGSIRQVLEGGAPEPVGTVRISGAAMAAPGPAETRDTPVTDPGPFPDDFPNLPEYRKIWAITEMTESERRATIGNLVTLREYVQNIADQAPDSSNINDRAV